MRLREPVHIAQDGRDWEGGGEETAALCWELLPAVLQTAAAQIRPVLSGYNMPWGGTSEGCSFRVAVQTVWQKGGDTPAQQGDERMHRPLALSLAYTLYI